MMRMSFVGFSLVVALAGAAMVSSAEAGCRRAGGVATMVTYDLAVFMANAALKNSIADHGERPAGPVQLKCTDDTLTTTCTARRQACK
ncbi:MAG TPA: hypothetical protein VIG38_12005 [Hyphomicrobium sp.]|jgi:hypothetical protein